MLDILNPQMRIAARGQSEPANREQLLSKLRSFPHRLLQDRSRCQSENVFRSAANRASNGAGFHQ